MQLHNPKIILIFTSIVLSLTTVAQTKCCDDSVCGKKADRYAGKISSLVTYLGKCMPASVTDYKRKNDSVLAEFEKNYPDAFNDFRNTIKIISEEFIENTSNENRQLCFFDALPIRTADNTMAWVNYIRDVKPVFPSTEFCCGFKTRIEISQGADAFLNKKNMAYLGSIRGYLVYTFPPKNKCGGRVRLMTGPGYFLRSATSYITLNSRIGLRLGDIKGGIFSLGNFNFFGGYNTNFKHFNYAESGFEAELGWLGFNLSAIYNTDQHHWGFMTGIVLANKKIKK